jgi:D-tyrosyl-tRNA(Tyr) deacylase
VRALIQRVSEAQVAVEGAVLGEIGPGLLVLVCAMQGDTEAQADKLAAKIAKLRIFRDEADRMNLSVREVSGAALVVSQFTLAAETKGNRPGFSTAAPPGRGQAPLRALRREAAGRGRTRGHRPLRRRHEGVAGQ